MVVGSPAKILRQVSDKEIEWKSKGTAEYQQLAVRSQTTMERVEPLREVEEDRKRIQIKSVEPLYKARAGTSDKAAP